MKEHIKQLGGETLVYGLSNAITKFFALLLLPIYARVFTTSEYGVIATFTSFIGGVFILVVLGLDMATARWYYINGDDAYKKNIISSWHWFQSIWGLLIAALILILKQPILRLLAIPPSYSYLIVFVVGLLLLQTYSKVTINTLRLLRRPWTTLAFSAISMALLLIGVIFFIIVLKRGIKGFYIAQIIMAGISGIVGISIIRRWIAPQYFDIKKLREMIRFGLPVVPVGLFQWIIMSSDRILLANMADTSEVGIYAVAYSLISPLGLLTAAFTMAYGPFSMSLINQPNSRAVYAKVLTLYAVGGCFICTVLSLFAKDIINLITTPKYNSAAGIIPFLAFSGLIYGAVYIAITGLSIAKKTYLITLGTFFGAALNIGLNLLLIPTMKKEGAALSFLISTFVSLVMVFYLSQKKYFIPYQFGMALLFFLHAWCLIGIDRYLLQGIPRSLLTQGLRVCLCLTFMPAMYRMKILRKENITAALKIFFRIK